MTRSGSSATDCAWLGIGLGLGLGSGKGKGFGFGFGFGFGLGLGLGLGLRLGSQLLPQLAVARPLHEPDGARHVPPVLEHQLERLAVETHTPQHEDLRGIRVQPGVMAAAAYECMGLQPGRMRLQPRAR